ncbi:MAG: EamA family transporter [Candidatus Methylumidiphilus sp.]
MKNKLVDYIYILLTIGLTVYGQIILKWRIRYLGKLPDNISDKIKFLVSLIYDPGIFSGFFAAFLASLAWMAAMTKFDLSHAYPFMSLNFVLVLLLSGLIFSESVTTNKIVGVTFIVIGTLISSYE